MTKAREEWRDIPKYKGLYQVSSFGRVKSLLPNEILKPWKNKNGTKYRLILALWKNKHKSRFYVHQLVLQAFVGKCPAGMEVCHNDGDSENNSIDNLRYGTHKSNMEDMIRDGNHWFSNNPEACCGARNGMSKIDEKQVIEIIKLVRAGTPQYQIAEQFNISQSTVSAIEHGKLWKHLTNGLSISRRINKGSSKLTSNDLGKIRMSIKEGIPLKIIAEQFGVGYKTVNRIKKNQTNRNR